MRWFLLLSLFHSLLVVSVEGVIGALADAGDGTVIRIRRIASSGPTEWSSAIRISPTRSPVLASPHEKALQFGNSGLERFSR